jgi:hypothetical protein
LIARPQNIRRGGSQIPEAQANYKARADWWLGLAGTDRQEELAVKIGAAWMDVDGSWGLQWLSTKVPAGRMRAFLEHNTEWTIYPLAHYPNGPSPAELESKLSALVGQLKQQFPAETPAILAGIFSKNQGQPGLESVKKITAP